MKIIRKQILFFLQPTERVVVPKGALHLDLQKDGDDYVFWYVCDPDDKKEQLLKFRMVGTNEPLEDDFIKNNYWIKTIREEGESWHFFLAR